MKRLTIAVVLILLVAGGIYFYWSDQQAKAAATTQPAGTQTVALGKGTISQTVSSVGRVVSNLDVEIKCKASGEIVELPFDVSQEVKRGDLLVQIDPIDEQRAVHQAGIVLAGSKAKLIQSEQNLKVAEANLVTARAKAQANVAATEAKVKDARAKLERRRAAVEARIVTQEDIDTAEAELALADANAATARADLEDIKAQEIAVETRRQDVVLARAQVESDQIALDNANQRLTDTKVMAPMDGIISALTVQRGQIISSGITNVGGGTSMMTLSDLSRIFVLAAVDESDIGKVALEQRVRITADAFPGQAFRGHVVRIATKGLNTSNVITFEVKIEVVGENKNLLKPEMTTNVNIIAAEKRDVLVAPVGAVTRKGRETVATVALAGGKTEDRPVQTGLSDGEVIEIVSGLDEGAIVVKRDEQQSRWRADGAQGPRMGGPMMMGGMRSGGGGGGGGGRR